MHRQLMIVGLVACLTGASLVAATGEAEAVQQKLKAFARMTKGEPTGLTYEDYLAANQDIKENMSADQMEELRQKSPEFRLFQDFVLTPMDGWRPAVMDDEVVHEAYVRRMEQTFKRFWPAYVDRRSIGKFLLFNGKHFGQFVKTLRKEVEEEPTLEAWRQSFIEYGIIRKKVEEMARYEDVYDQLDEFEYKVNYLNSFYIKNIMDRYADRFNECKTTEEMKPIVDEFRRIFRVS